MSPEPLGMLEPGQEQVPQGAQAWLSFATGLGAIPSTQGHDLRLSGSFGSFLYVSSCNSSLTLPHMAIPASSLPTPPFRWENNHFAAH